MGKRQLHGLGGAMGLVIILFTSTITVSPVRTIDGRWASDFRPYGGYIDELLLKIYEEQPDYASQVIEALQQDEIDAYDDRVSLEYLPALESHPDIHVSYTVGTWFRMLSLNCGRFPTNITGYRRAMAFGMDKTRATEEAYGRFGTPLDSIIPASLPEWTVEDQLPEHFYDEDIESGNRSLEAAGFKDLDNDGWREYDKNNNDLWDAGIDIDDNDSRLAINLTATAEWTPAVIMCTFAQEGLTKMGIRSTVEEIPFKELVANAYEGNFWASCVSDMYRPWFLPPQYLYRYYRTGGEGWSRFSNVTIDAILDKMYAATTDDDRKKYCREAAILLAYEQPEIAINNEMILNAYRTDKFEGYYEYKGLGTSIYVNYLLPAKIHLKKSEGGPYGGIFRYCVSKDLTTKNIFNLTDDDPYLFNYIYETLWYVDPNTWDPIPSLAHDWNIEPTLTNNATGIQNGQKFTFYLVENATWHDGQPVTSEDVYYSYELLINSRLGPSKLPFIYKKETLDDHTFVLYVNRTDPWAWADITYLPFIVPWHIWKNAVNLTDFKLLPDFEATDEYLIGSGPFKWNERVAGKYISLLRHEDWHWAIPHETEPSTTSTTSFFSQESAAPISGIVSVFAIVVTTVIYVKRRRK